MKTEVLRARSQGVRALRRLDWERDAAGVAVGCVVADAFCHNMVRALVGALLPVGEGSRPPSWPSAAKCSMPAARCQMPQRFPAAS